MPVPSGVGRSRIQSGRHRRSHGLHARARACIQNYVLHACAHAPLPCHVHTARVRLRARHVHDSYACVTRVGERPAAWCPARAAAKLVTRAIWHGLVGICPPCATIYVTIISPVADHARAVVVALLGWRRAPTPHAAHISFTHCGGRGGAEGCSGGEYKQRDRHERDNRNAKVDQDHRGRGADWRPRRARATRFRPGYRVV